MKFRKKPVVIDATHWFPGVEVEGVVMVKCDQPLYTHPFSSVAGDEGVSFSTVEKVVKALSRIGHTFPESQEEQSARFESMVLDLCREVQSCFDQLLAEQVEPAQADTYHPSDADVHSWMERSDIDGHKITAMRSAIEDARSMHLLHQPPTNPPEIGYIHLTLDKSSARATALLCRALVNDDEYAISFQSMRRYRTSLIEKIDGFIKECESKPEGNN